MERLMERLKQKRNSLKNAKGFTLVELIIVMVIIAILAAALVPTMMGYIDDSKNSANASAARAYYVAAQSIVTKGIAEDKTITTGTKDSLNGSSDTSDTLVKQWTELVKELPGEVTFTADSGVVTGVLYRTTDRYVKITYTQGSGNAITYGKIGDSEDKLD